MGRQSCITFIFFLLFVQAHTRDEVNIGLVVDFKDDQVGEILWSCVNLALSDINHTKFIIKTRHIGTTLASKAVMELINDEEVQAIFIKPETLALTKFVAELGEQAQVPIISFSPTALPSNLNSYFFKAVRSSEKIQAKALTEIIQALGWREAVAIYTNDEYGQAIIPHLAEAFEVQDIRVPYWAAISPSATYHQTLEKLSVLKTMSTGVFIVHVSSHLGSQIFTIAKEIGMMREGYIWILTEEMTTSLHLWNPLVINSMHNVLGIKTYIPETDGLKDLESRWKMKLQKDHPDMVDAEMNVYGLYAYDATICLANAFAKLDVSGKFWEENDATQIGPKLVQALCNTSFKGLAGDFLFVNQQLQFSAFQVVNVAFNGVRGIGYWTPENGLVNLTASVTNTSAAIVWPGDSTFVPKGWELQRRTKLRVLVPVRNGFKEFVNASKVSANTNASSVTGYCIDVFEAVIHSVPYAASVEYFTSNATNYNDLILQVYHGNYDAVVGDVTIITNRSKLVDFTLPYMTSGVSMIIPKETTTKVDAWMFLKPFSLKLWLTAICSFVYIGLVIWLLEHRLDMKVQKSPPPQNGNSFWFPFSTLIFSHREKEVSQLTRVVMMIWCFITLILVQSYTASLTSQLTVKKIQSDLDTSELMRHNVGYQKGSFVGRILQDLGFDESRLFEYDSAEECHQLLSRGGITAALDETPYLKLIQAQSCEHYSIIDFKASYHELNIQKFPTNGIGFVFPKGSPLATETSRAILELMDRVEFREIEEKWFGNLSCDDNFDASQSLDVSNFWGLFLIAGTASTLALVIHTTKLVRQYKEVIKSSSSKTSGRKAICNFLTIFTRTNLHPSSKDVADDERVFLNQNSKRSPF